MSAAKRRKAYPQLIAIELILVAAGALAAWYLLPLAGVPHSIAMFAAGIAADRALILLLRHRNKPLLPNLKLPFSVLKPAPGKTAPRKKAA